MAIRRDTGFVRAEELRRPCVWMHHGQVVMNLPDTGLRREFLVPDSKVLSDALSRPTMAYRRARVYRARPKNDGTWDSAEPAGLNSPFVHWLPTLVGRTEETGFQETG
jgi:hypothetical protein